MNQIAENRISKNWMARMSLFIGNDGNAWAIKKEKAIEAQLTELLGQIGIRATVKSDRYSLPATGSVMSSNSFDSYIPAIYSADNVSRKFIKEILNADCQKVRFYVYIHTEDYTGKNILKRMSVGTFNIEIRYYLHKNQ